MAVDIQSLKKFADTFGPAIEAIPAVIDAVSKSQDLERHIVQKQAELSAVMQKVDEAKAQGDEFVKNTQLRADAIIIAADEYAAQAKADADKVKADVKEAKAKADAKVAEFNAKVMAAQADADAAETAAQARKNALELQHEQAVKSMAEQIAALEDRYAKAEKDLAKIRAKLGD